MIIIRYDIIRHIDFIKRRINPFSQQLVCIRVGILGLGGKRLWLLSNVQSMEEKSVI